MIEHGHQVTPNAASAASSNTQRSIAVGVDDTLLDLRDGVCRGSVFACAARPWLVESDHDDVQRLAQQRVGPTTGRPVAHRAAALERTRHGDHVRVVGAVDVDAVGHRGGIERAAVTATGGVIVNVGVTCRIIEEVILTLIGFASELSVRHRPVQAYAADPRAVAVSRIRHSRCP